MNIRYPSRAGSFYEAQATTCRHQAGKLLNAAELPDDLPARILGGLVPHAGWMYSGRLAALTLKALQATGPLDTLVLLGADHTGAVRKGEVYDSGVWRTPLGDVPVDRDLAEALLEAAPCLRSNPQAHAHEHSLEVQVPLLQVLSPGVKIVPIAVPPTDLAVEIGAAVGALLAARFPAARVVGSTDLTHHAGHFPAPGGHGKEGVDWTVRNDRRMLDLIEAMHGEEVVAEAYQHGNACGAGAIAAAIAACRAMGATAGRCLEYTNSYDVIHAIYPGDPDDTTVGYASVVFS
jgi:AmmeMemoRadiSam system protein B